MADQAMYHQVNQSVFVGGRLWNPATTPCIYWQYKEIEVLHLFRCFTHTLWASARIWPTALRTCTNSAQRVSNASHQWISMNNDPSNSVIGSKTHLPRCGCMMKRICRYIKPKASKSIGPKYQKMLRSLHKTLWGDCATAEPHQIRLNMLLGFALWWSLNSSSCPERKGDPDRRWIVWPQHNLVKKRRIYCTIYW